MPANLTPQYFEAEEAFKNAQTAKEKIRALEEMLAVIPKHKGTEKLQAEIKKRLSKLRQEESKVKSTASRYDPFHIESEGAGQIALVGFPNCGKSTLVSRLSRAKVKIGDYPFTTTIPVAGMMPYEDILIQLVDTPPISDELIPSGLGGLLKNADARLVIIDAGSDDCLEHLEKILGYFDKRRIPLEQTVIAANRMDICPGEEIVEMIKTLIPENLPLLLTSSRTGSGLEELRRTLFRHLQIIRVYTKVPGKEADTQTPFVLPYGSTIWELANSIHKDLARRLKNARVWGSTRYPGQSVPKEYELHDRDIVELNQ